MFISYSLKKRLVNILKTIIRFKSNHFLCNTFDFGVLYKATESNYRKEIYEGCFKGILYKGRECKTNFVFYDSSRYDCHDGLCGKYGRKNRSNQK